MSKLGSTLKNKRETLGYDLDKVTEQTRISADIIAVLERGEYKSMPSYNHAKNFVKNYAEYLKMDLDEVQSLLDDECTKEDFNREVKYVAAPVTKETSAAPSGVKYIIPAILIIIILFTGFKVFTAMEKGKDLKQTEINENIKKEVDETVDNPVSNDEVKEVIENLNQTEQQDSLSDQPVPDKENKPQTPAKENSDSGKVDKDENAAMAAFMPEKKEEPAAVAKTAYVNFADVCWVHISIDGKEEMDFIAEKGNQREVTFRDYFLMDIGNAAVVSISYNNRTIAGLGAYKQPVKGLRFAVDDSNRLRYKSIK
ncbi:conserved hypothetical protein [Denitrovibrio acetiphilus DSM 12809]|uniref:Cytoskeleton protein RodZ-like C-terminal domain-containing protein n=1 Tax=Denitrovibrio acetiphilus (strain DSM 12809 / NBRC 114555 / N2460) TaxID=522772 RepID=D4H7L4_DENA2|nr:RodZ domain-containing protein [Denitrovibrio acetiphilus]ADD68013.1 conserved hypothetical protein [Denitrovibrio acetiphilus DSM 12809]